MVSSIQTSIELAVAMSLWREGRPRREIARDRLRRMAKHIGALLLGAAGGAGGYAVLGFTSLLPPRR